MKLNRDMEMRDKIIFEREENTDNYKKYLGGIRKFKNLTLNQLERLIENNFIDLEEHQNSSPTTEDFYNFLKEYPDFTLSGYAVHVNKNNYRVTINEINKNGEISIKDVIVINKNLHLQYADEVTIEDDYISLWWD